MKYRCLREDRLMANGRAHALLVQSTRPQACQFDGSSLEMGAHPSRADGQWLTDGRGATGEGGERAHTSLRADRLEECPVADISVVIPSCNRTDLAWETVASVLAQSQPVKEIILVANGSDEHAAFWRTRSSGRLRVIR